MKVSVGVDVGGSFIKAVAWDGDDVSDRLRLPSPSTPPEILDVVAELARSLGNGVPVGVGLAGLVDHRRGVLVWAPHLPGEEVEVTKPLSARLGVPVAADNDANLAALAEQRRGAAVGAASIVMLTLGTGIGMGLVINGEIYRGRAHAGEVGHVTVQLPGRPCACGRRGCWETTISGTRLDQDAREVLGETATASDLVSAAQAGNPEARARLAEAGEWLGRGIETLMLALDPEVIVVGGAAAQAGDLLLGPVRDRLARTEGAGHRDSPHVTASILGPDAGAIGAAIMAADQEGT